MGKASKRESHSSSQLLSGLSGGLASSSRAVLDFAKASGSDAGIVAACSMLVAANHAQARPQESLLEAPLDQLVECETCLSKRVLLHFAKAGQVTRVRLEATRRLGNALDLPEVRAFLKEAAKQGLSTNTHYSNDNVGTENFRIAAIAALGAPKSARAEVTACLLDIMKEQAETLGPQGRPTKVFFRCIDSLDGIVKKKDIDDLLVCAESCKNNLAALSIISLCGRVSKGISKDNRQRLTSLLCERLTEAIDERPLRERLELLACNLSSVELIKELSRRYASQDLMMGKGRVIAAALESCDKTDRIIADACLQFLSAPNNAREDNPCVTLLSRYCQQSGPGPVAGRLVSGCATHYAHVFGSGLVFDILGEPSSAVPAVLQAIPKGENPQANNALLQSLDVYLRKMAAVVCRAWMTKQRSDGAIDNEVTDEPNALADALAEVPGQEDVFHLAARYLVRCQDSAPAVDLSRRILKRKDELAWHFLWHCLRCGVEISSDDIPSLKSLEPDIAHHRDHLQENGVDLVLVDGKLNRYFLDFVRRKQLGFAGLATNALRTVTTPEDVQHIAQALADDDDPGSMRALIEATRMSRAGDADLMYETQACALNALPKSWLSASRDEGLEVEALTAIRCSFEGVTEVRKAAYRAAGEIGHPMSISPLKERLDTEKDEDCQREIDKALQRIESQLLETAPNHNDDARQIVEWLGNVALLASPELLDAVHPFLQNPHPGLGVSEAALRSVSKIGDSRSLHVVEEFVSRTSPSGERLRVARRAKLVLLQRADLCFYDILGELYDERQDVFDPDAVDFSSVFGERLQRITQGVKEALEYFKSLQWDAFVTKLAGVSEAMNRHLFENHHDLLGWDCETGSAKARQKHGNRIQMREFREAFPQLAKCMKSVQDLRHDAKTPHIDDESGNERPGISEDDGRHCLDQFRKLLRLYVTAVVERPEVNTDA